MAKSTKSPVWPSQAKSGHSELIGGLSSVIRPQPVKEILFPRSLDLNISFEIKYRR
jgi:hypothetical protein